MMMKPFQQLRVYRFMVEVLDEPDCSDDDFADEFTNALVSYFEAIDVTVELISATEYEGIPEA